MSSLPVRPLPALLAFVALGNLAAASIPCRCRARFVGRGVALGAVALYAWMVVGRGDSLEECEVEGGTRLLARSRRSGGGTHAASVTGLFGWLSSCSPGLVFSVSCRLGADGFEGELSGKHLTG